MQGEDESRWSNETDGRGGHEQEQEQEQELEQALDATVVLHGRDRRTDYGQPESRSSTGRGRAGGLGGETHATAWWRTEAGALTRGRCKACAEVGRGPRP
jgi:hypothetical protein